ncbi:MAG: outer membrane protein transport protein [Desulfobacterales bacterium]|nr:MAG: outer membrane protein transport protein [Desulfobacterales bacterium]
MLARWKRIPGLGGFVLSLFLLAAVRFAGPGWAQEGPDIFTTIDIPSSFNPVGSGARALGMGGAFIAVADDATAASWNPGGLIQLDRPEISAVGTFLYRVEEINFGTNPEADGRESVTEANLNYLSLAYPFRLFGYNMIVSLNYQQLFDFYREWNFPLREDSDEFRIDFDQSGHLYALGVAYSIRILPQISFGLTLNFWEDFLYDNQWRATTKTSDSFTIANTRAIDEIKRKEEFSFSGFNLNLGLLWNATGKLTVGAVFKSPFTADLDLRLTQSRIRTVQGESPQESSFTITEDQELDMPMSYGLGIAYRLSDQFTLSADVTRTHWNDFILQDEAGRKTSPISGLPDNESDIDPTIQVRTGAEYLLIRPKFVIPVRAGFFYDPAPAERDPDDFFGFSLGTGIGIDRFVFDVAYQYRFGRDVGAFIDPARKFSQDVDEHKVFSSLIIHF